jgi:hypothetical protein
MTTLRARLLWFGGYLAANLAIILGSIWLWSLGRPQEALFVGLWAPTMNSLYLMAVLTFTPGRWPVRPPTAAPLPGRAPGATRAEAAA